MAAAVMVAAAINAVRIRKKAASLICITADHLDRFQNCPGIYGSSLESLKNAAFPFASRRRS
jgi:hypothetical protein